MKHIKEYAQTSAYQMMKIRARGLDHRPTQKLTQEIRRLEEIILGNQKSATIEISALINRAEKAEKLLDTYFSKFMVVDNVESI